MIISNKDLSLYMLTVHIYIYIYITYTQHIYTHVLVKTNIPIQKRAGFLGGARISHLHISILVSLCFHWCYKNDQNASMSHRHKEVCVEY